MRFTRQVRRDYAGAVDRYNLIWSEYDATLYRVCERHRSHADLSGVVAKVGLVGRAYAAGLERAVSNNDRENGLAVVARHFHRRRDAIDRQLERLQAGGVNGRRLDAETLALVADVHGRIVRIVRGARGVQRDPRSFVSKYLHFHWAGVPIFDSRAVLRLRTLFPFRGRAIRTVKRSAFADYQYWRFCNQFLALWNSAVEGGLKPTVRNLDVFLLAT